MYVCICNAVSEAQIQEAAANGARTLTDLETMLGVATGCGTCAEEADQCLREARRLGSPASPSPSDFQLA